MNVAWPVGVDREPREDELNITDLGHILKPALLVLLLPPVPPLLLAGLGAVLAAGRRLRLGRWTLVLGMAGVWLCCCEGTGQWMTRHLLHAPTALEARTFAALNEQSRKSGDVAVLVLGAGVRSYVPEYFGSDLQDLTLQRLRYGVWLARRLGAPLGFTGGIGFAARSGKLPEATVAGRVARDEFGMPLRWAESRSRDTRENAAFSLPLLKASGIRKLVLVTHQQHMPRALQAFNVAAQGEIEIVAAPVGLLADGMSGVLDWCPSAEGFATVRYVVYEWLGRLAGH